MVESVNSAYKLQFSGKNKVMFPGELTVELTKRCSLNCLICSSNGGIEYPNQLTVEEFKKIINDAWELGTRTIIFSGGEPFEHPRLIGLCEHAKSYDLNVWIYTSGNLGIGEPSIEPISESSVSSLKKLSLDRVIFGLQGPTDRIHDLMTCAEGSFKNAMISIKRFVGMSIPVEIHFVPTKLNYRTLPQMFVLAKKLQVDKISVLRFVAQGRGELNCDMLKLDPHELSVLRSMLKDMLNSKDIKVRLGAPFNAFCLSEGNRCTAGKSRATIRSDGFVFPCEAMKQLRYSDNDLRKASLKEIWQKSTIFQEARNFGILINKSLCGSCRMFSKCKGGCPAQRLIRGFSVQRNPDPLCLATEVIMKNV